ncbi:hypothetical protein B0O99DRAFT_634311 [Bisporella sp. PMI_857]|nr:hypothetical protein B0O99DRAFT_634311 [Bisporella sp. PMI_857]
MSYVYPPWGSISQKYTFRLEGLKKNGLGVSDIFGGKILSQPLQKPSLYQIRHKIDDTKTDPERDGLSLNWTNTRGQGRTDDFLVIILNHRDKALCFAVFLEKVESRLYFDIYRHDEGNAVFWADAVPREFTIDSTTHLNRPSRDRLSTRLESGQSVTVVAKKGPAIRDSGQCKDRNHYNIVYKIHISIDDTGYLPFPRLESPDEVDEISDSEE